MFPHMRHIQRFAVALQSAHVDSDGVDVGLVNGTGIEDRVAFAGVG